MVQWRCEGDWRLQGGPVLCSAGDTPRPLPYYDTRTALGANRRGGRQDNPSSSNRAINPRGTPRLHGMPAGDSTQSSC
jgi:hypothetical protein